jgi:cell fate regulator YaaT (PSP1 superfamily)
LDSGWDLPSSAPQAASTQYGYDDDDSGPLIPPLRLLAGPAPEPADPDGDEVFADLAESEPGHGTLANVVGIKFRDAGKIYDFDAGDASYARDEIVVVDSESGLVLGTVAAESGRRLIDGGPLRRVLRKADANDRRQMTRNKQKEAEALAFARDRVRERRMDMKVFRAEYLHGGHKAIFYFTSEARIDFRDLVKDLAARLHTRIEMRQIGVRDEAKMVGGIGDCGRELCCSTFLPQFAPVSIRMAKDQGIVLNPSRVSGQCGRLKCCLVYEEALYRELRKGMPKVGKRVETPEGDGRVQELDVLRRRVRVSLMVGGTRTFEAAEVKPIIPPQQQGGRPPEPEPEEEPPAGVPTE